MPLVFGHVRLDLGQFPHLMPQGCGIAAGEFLAAASALSRLERLHVVAVLGGDQRSLMFFVPRLSAAFLLRPTLGQGGFGMGMHAAGRQRGVLGRLSPAFQLLDGASSLAISASNRRMMAWASGGWRAMISSVTAACMPTVVPRKPHLSPDQFVKKSPPGCERLHSPVASAGGTRRRGRGEKSRLGGSVTLAMAACVLSPAARDLPRGNRARCIGTKVRY